MFKLLVERGADIHVNDDAAISSVIWQHAYGYKNYESVIRYLAGLGCRPRDLYHCAIAGNLKAAKLVVELGADINQTDKSRSPDLNPEHTALDYCTGKAGEQFNEDPEVATDLREHGAKHGTELGQGRRGRGS